MRKNISKTNRSSNHWNLSRMQ